VCRGRVLDDQWADATRTEVERLSKAGKPKRRRKNSPPQPARCGDVVAAIRQRRGQAAVKTFDAAREGTHERYQGDLRHFVQETERLADAIRA
jgi:hypothetical protein